MRVIFVAATVAASSFSGLVAAQDVSSKGGASAAEVEGTLTEVVVTATRTGETRLQDTPLAITAVDRQLMENSAIRDIRDIQSLTPSLTISQNARAAQPYIRGVGSNNSFAGSDPSIALYMDGVYVARPTSFFTEFVGVERVEVLRGPQGTLYGRNSIGGAVNIISRRPGDELEAEARVSVGNYDLRAGEVYLNVPMADGKVAVSAAGRYSDRDGYYENVVPDVGRSDVERDRMTQVQLRVTPNDALDVVLRADYSHTRSTIGTSLKTRTPTGYDPIVDSLLGEPTTLAFSYPATADIEDRGVSAEITFDLSDTLQLRSITAYRDSEGTRETDNDFSAAQLRYSLTGQDQDQVSQELLLSGGAGALNFVTGVYYIEEDIRDSSRIPMFTNNTMTVISPHVRDKAIAGFAQGTYAFNPQWSVTAGVRYTDERKNFDQVTGTQNASTEAWLAGNPVTYSIEREDDAWTPKLGVEYRPRADLLFYASATKGFKSGGYAYTSRNSLQGFDPEELLAYEAGMKSDWLGRALRVNVSAFRYDYTDMQVQSFITLGVIDIVNAASSTVDGVELETQFRPTDGLVLGASATWLDAKYDEFPAAIGPGNISYDASGRQLNAAPDFAYALSAEYRRPIFTSTEIFGRVDYAWRDRTYFTAQNIPLESQESYGLLHANLGFVASDGRFEVTLFGRNLTDEVYVTTASTVGAVSYGTLAGPRTYGMKFTARY